MMKNAAINCELPDTRSLFVFGGVVFSITEPNPFLAHGSVNHDVPPKLAFDVNVLCCRMSELRVLWPSSTVKQAFRCHC